MPLPLKKPKTVADSLLLGSLRQQLGLLRYQEGVVRSILDVLTAAEVDLERQLRLSLEKRRQSTPSGVRLRLIRQELRGAIREAYEAIGEEIPSRLAGLATRSAGAHARVIEGALPFAFSMTRPDPGLLEAIATRNPFEGRLLATHVSTLEQSMQAELLRAVQVGLVLGESNDQITRRVFGTEAAGFADGALNLSRHQAASLTRTAVQHVHGEARDQLYDENLDIITGVMGVVTLDERTCKICGPRDGKVWDLPGHKPNGHSEAWGAGPGRWHMGGCRCSSIPVLGPLEAFEDLGVDIGALAGGERAAYMGPVSSGTDYEDWLRDSSVDVKQGALGKARAAWWDSRPGVSLSDAWAQRFGGLPVQTATIDEVFPVGPLDPLGTQDIDHILDMMADDFDFANGVVAGYDGDAVSRELASVRGFDGAPMDLPEGAEGLRAYRGVTDARFADEFIDGPYFSQTGTIGNGNYFAYNEDDHTRALAGARAYSQASGNVTGRGVIVSDSGGGGGLVEIVIPPSARTISFDELRGLQETYRSDIDGMFGLADRLLERAFDEGDRTLMTQSTRTRKKAEALEKMVGDPGKLALMLGYDVVVGRPLGLTKYGELTVLNRGAVWARRI